jgi:hypothetical protein
MYIRTKPKKQLAMTFVEVIIASALFSLTGLVLFSLNNFSLRSFAALSNYATLDQSNREAVDQLTCEIRQAKEVTDRGTGSITILNGEGDTVTFKFVPAKKQLVRTSSDGSFKILLEDCHLLEFHLFQRNPVEGTFNDYPVATENWQKTVKGVQLTWKTSRSLPNGLVNSENVQTARIVIRKQTNED